MRERAKIYITHHAKKRLGERFPDVDCNGYQQFVAAARYNGLSISQVEQIDHSKAKEIIKRFYGNKSTKLKYYKNAIFVFAGNSGKSRTLLTVVNL